MKLRCAPPAMTFIAKTVSTSCPKKSALAADHTKMDIHTCVAGLWKIW